MEENNNLSSQTINLNNLNNGVIPPVQSTPVATNVSVESPVYNQPNTSNTVVSNPGINYVPNPVTTIPNGVTINQVQQPVTNIVQQPAQVTPQYVSSESVVVTGTVNTQPVTESAVQNVAPVSEATPAVQQPQIFDNYKIKTETLRNFLNNAVKVAIGEARIMLTTVIMLEFSNNGFKMIAADGDLVLVQKDSNCKFTNELSIGVSADLFPKLVSKIDSEYVELVPDASNRTIKVIADNDEFILSEIYDTQTGEVVNIDDRSNSLNTSPIKFNFDEFKDIIKKANILSGNGNVNNELGGIYCAEKICTTDKSNAFGSNNLPELKDETFYLSAKYVKVLVQLDFGTETTLSFQRAEDGVNKAVAINSDSVYFFGALDPTIDQFPVDNVRALLKVDFDNSITISRSKVVSILDKAALFLVENQDDSACSISIDGGASSITIRNFNGSTKQTINVNGVNIPTTSFNINIKNTIKSLNNFDSDQVTLKVGNENSGEFIILQDEKIKQLLSMV